MSAEITNNVNNFDANDEEDDVVDPWNVVSKSETGIDYDKLISEPFELLNATSDTLCVLSRKIWFLENRP